MNHAAKLYLIPTLLHPNNPNILLPSYLSILATIRHFVVEDIRTSRRFLRSVIQDFDIDHSTFWEIDKHNPNQEYHEAIHTLKSGHDVGLLSEAGCPGIADPGSVLVLRAHEEDIPVVPWIGPSSIALSLMASGMNGQGFSFHGYLPSKPETDLIKKIKQLESESVRSGYSQIFIETPYRNQNLLIQLLKNLKSTTLLCIAVDLTADAEMIKTKTVEEWKKQSPDLSKRPAIFILQSQV